MQIFENIIIASRKRDSLISIIFLQIIILTENMKNNLVFILRLTNNTTILTRRLFQISSYYGEYMNCVELQPYYHCHPVTIVYVTTIYMSFISTQRQAANKRLVKPE